MFVIKLILFYKVFYINHNIFLKFILKIIYRININTVKIICIIDMLILIITD